MNAAGYIRVSSKGQDHTMQRSAIERAAAARGDTIGEWYAEKRTAKTMDRPELARLEGAITAGTVRRVYVFRLDRLTRTGIADTLDVVKRWREAGVDLVNLSDGFSVPPPGADGSAARVAELILAILGWAAEMELYTRRERIAARRALAEERGEAWGRPSRLDAATRAAIAERRARGESVRAIAVALKVPRSTVARVERCPASSAVPIMSEQTTTTTTTTKRRALLAPDSGPVVSRNPPPPRPLADGPESSGEQGASGK